MKIEYSKVRFNKEQKTLIEKVLKRCVNTSLIHITFHNDIEISFYDLNDQRYQTRFFNSKERLTGYCMAVNEFTIGNLYAF